MHQLANLVGNTGFDPIVLSNGGQVGAARPQELLADYRLARRFSVSSVAVDAALRAVLTADVLAHGKDAASVRGDRLFGSGMPNRSSVPQWIEFDVPAGPLRDEIPVVGSSRFGCLFSPGREGDAWETRAVAVAASSRSSAGALPVEIRYDAAGHPMEPEASMDMAWELVGAVATLASIASATLAALSTGVLIETPGPSLDAVNKGRARRGKLPLASYTELVVAT